MILIAFNKEDYIKVLLKHFDIIIKFSAYDSKVVELIRLLYSLISSLLAYELRNNYFILNITLIITYLILYYYSLELRPYNVTIAYLE